MNKMLVKQGLRALFTMLVVFGAVLFVSTTAHAQQFSDKDVTIASQQNFMDPNSAMGVLKQSVDQLHVALPGMNGQQLQLATMRVQYHKSLLVHLTDGMSVKTALDVSLGDAVIQDSNKTSVGAGLEPLLIQIYVETANLLAI